MEIDGLDDCGETSQSIDAGDEEELQAVLKTGDGLQPEPGAFYPRDPQAEDFRFARHVDADEQMDRLDPNAVILDFDVDAVAMNDGIKRIQGASLPCLHFINDGSVTEEINVGETSVLYINSR